MSLSCRGIAHYFAGGVPWLGAAVGAAVGQCWGAGTAGSGQHVGGGGEQVLLRDVCCSAAALGGRSAGWLEMNPLPFPFQTIHDQILQEYRKIKKVSANFWP